MPISSLPDGHVYAYAEEDDAIKTTLRLKEVMGELNQITSIMHVNALNVALYLIIVLGCL